MATPKITFEAKIREQTVRMYADVPLKNAAGAIMNVLTQISQIKKFVECFILRKHFYRKIRLIYYIIYCFLTVVKNLVKKKHNI